VTGIDEEAEKGTWLLVFAGWLFCFDNISGMGTTSSTTESEKYCKNCMR
jgi:hypothetical protein